jgi:molybdenum cofactor biosynthesis protein B
MSSKMHKAHTPDSLTLAIVTVSTTRTLAEDQSGLWMKRKAEEKGEVVFHGMVLDDREMIAETISTVIQEYQPNIILVNGGTGISPADVTIEAVRPMFDKELSAFGPLFAQLSYREIDSAALLSRATAGVVNQTMVFCLPGSLNACKLAWKELIVHELGHLVKHMQEG